ncbi:hypothetical protein [Leucothrix mucor]|uniref:hypothetical protein n=1 Tax=Leucothrix mucor TaxID=45248 RepID=UPI001B7F8F31|nr:hypothetical protein [Leucothrix mucor]
MSKSNVLGDLAEVRLGLAFNSAIKDLGDKGSCYLIQTKNITLDGYVDLSELVRVEPEGSPQRHFLASGDVLLRLRGPVFSAAVFENTLSEPAVSTNQTAVIRCNTEWVSPYYLQWFINSPLGQYYFKRGSEGSNIAKVSSKTVSNMPLLLPSREQQQRIEVIHKNWLAQKEIYKRIVDNGDLLYGQLCMQIQMESSE